MEPLIFPPYHRPEQDHLVGVKEFHVARALLQGHQEHSQCAMSRYGWMVFSSGHCGGTSSSIDFRRYNGHICNTTPQKFTIDTKNGHI